MRRRRLRDRCLQQKALAPLKPPRPPVQCIRCHYNAVHHHLLPCRSVPVGPRSACWQHAASSAAFPHGHGAWRLSHRTQPCHSKPVCIKNRPKFAHWSDPCASRRRRGRAVGKQQQLGLRAAQLRGRHAASPPRPAAAVAVNGSGGQKKEKRKKRRRRCVSSSLPSTREPLSRPCCDQTPSRVSTLRVHRQDGLQLLGTVLTCRTDSMVARVHVQGHFSFG